MGREKPSELAQAIQVLNGPCQLIEAERQEMQQLRERLGTKFCHRCDYCQPCPQRIPISTVMYGSSHLKRLSPEQLFEGWLARAFDLALECSKCGECESGCPYHLPIRDVIEEQANIYCEAKRQHERSLVSRQGDRRKSLASAIRPPRRFPCGWCRFQTLAGGVV